MNLLSPTLWLVLVLSHGALFGAGYFNGVSDGVKSERVTWQEKEVARIESEQVAMLAAAADSSRIAKLNAENNRKAINENQAEKQAIRTAYERVTHVMRIDAAACNSVAAAGQAGGASGVDAASAGTIALPDKIADDLWYLARDADEVNATARGLQEWIKLNGMTGNQ